MPSSSFMTVLNELAQILRGEHPGWEGDRRANAYRFLTRAADTNPTQAKVDGLALAESILTYAEHTGISPSTLRQTAAIFLGSRQGSL